MGKDKYHELKIFEMLKVEDLITLGYRFDRLNTDDKLVLCYTVLTALIYGDLYEEIDSKIIDQFNLESLKNYLFIE